MGRDFFTIRDTVSFLGDAVSVSLTVLGAGKLSSESQFKRQKTRVGSELCAWEWRSPQGRGILGLCCCLFTFPTGLLPAADLGPREKSSGYEGTFRETAEPPVLSHASRGGEAKSVWKLLCRWCDWERLDSGLPKVSGTSALLKEAEGGLMWLGGQAAHFLEHWAHSMPRNPLSFLPGLCLHWPSWGQLYAQKARGQELASGSTASHSSACLPHGHVSTAPLTEDSWVLELLTQRIKCS